MSRSSGTKRRKNPLGRPPVYGETLDEQLPPTRVSSGQKGKLQRWADKEGVSLSEAVRRLIDRLRA